MNMSIKASVILVGTFIVINQAFSWGLSDLDPTNKNSAIRQGGRAIDPSNPNGAMGRDLHAKFIICNKTDWGMPYSINDRMDSLNPNACRQWTTTGQATMGFNTGAIGDKSYILNDGNYSFQKFYLGSPNAAHPSFYVDLRKD